MSDPLAPYDFELPENLIALRPVEPQDSARLLVIYSDGKLVDARIRDLPKFLSPRDVMVFNDTRVLPAALKGVRPKRDDNGSDVSCDVNLVVQVQPGIWTALARPGKRLRVGDSLIFGEDFRAEILTKRPDGQIDLKFSCDGADLHQALDKYGAMPLPPYIARKRPADAQDRQTYQTEFAGNETGSVAAPTAGLHFTQTLLSEIDASGIARETVRLHVGLGTFAPLQKEQIEANRLHAEWRSLSAETAARLNGARQDGGKIVAVGTTAMRTLESCVRPGGMLVAETGPTEIFLKPGDAIHATDALLTNFHLPRSSLLMLVSALIGTDIMQAAYAHAISEKYRFYSYGDACLVLP